MTMTTDLQVLEKLRDRYITAIMYFQKSHSFSDLISLSVHDGMCLCLWSMSRKNLIPQDFAVQFLEKYKPESMFNEHYFFQPPHPGAVYSENIKRLIVRKNYISDIITQMRKQSVQL